MGKKVTMYTIADEVGMSIAAVSRAFDPKSRLKPEKRKLILETAERLGYVQNKMAARLSGEPMKLGVLIYGTIAVYYDELAAGIRDAHNEYSDYKVICDLRMLDRSEHTFEDAYSVIDDFIDSGYDGAIISGLHKSANTCYVNRLAEAGIPFIMLGTDADGSLRSGVSMNDTETAGRMAAQLLSCVTAGNRSTAIFCSDLSNMGQRGLTEAFKRAAEVYKLDIVRICQTYDSPKSAYDMTRQLICEVKNLGGIYITSANSAPVCHYINEVGKSGQIGIIASDVFGDLNNYLRGGTVFATIYQDPFYQARAAFEALFYRIAEGTPIPEFIHSRPQAVFESNLNLYENGVDH